MNKIPSFDEVASELLDVGNLGKLLFRGDGKDLNPGLLDDNDFYKLQLEVCRLSDVQPDKIAELSEEKLLQYMILALGKKRTLATSSSGNEASKEGLRHFKEQTTAGQQPIDHDWPNQTKVANGLKTNKTKIARLIKEGILKTNGKTGRDCRVNPASVLKYCNEEGVTYNET